MRNLTQDEAQARAAVLDVASYDIALDLTRGPTTFVSTTTVRFSATPGSRTFLELDGVLEHGTLDGRPLALEGNRIALDGLGGEHEVTITATCSYTRSGEGLHRFVDPADDGVYVYSQAFLDDAQRFFACFDQPDLKAVFRLRVTAPDGHVVRSGTQGSLVDGVHVFAETRRLSTYHVALCAGPWFGVQQEHDGLTLGWWCRQSEAQHLEGEELMAITKAAFAHQQQRFGSRYPFGDTYDQVFVPEFNAGAMENPGMVTYSEMSLLFRSRATEGMHRLRAQVIAHEMAHMWFGNLVTMQWWDGIWLNESFAEYMGLDTVENALPYDGVWADFCLGRKAWGYRADALPTTHPVAPEVTDNRAALQNFDGISYAKGASCLRQLVALVGEDDFFTGLRAYLAENAWGNATLADLLGSVETASGRDLHAWATAWLETSGTDTLRMTRDQGLLRTGDSRRDHLVGVGAYDDVDGQLVLRESVRVELTGNSAPVELEGTLLLPNDGDLTFAKIRFDPSSLAVVLARLRDLADPLARALCWGSLWDALRDGELAAADHTRAVLAGVVAEHDPSLVETLLGQARTAATLYSPPAVQRELLATLSAGSWEAATEPGSDLQLVRVRAAVSATRDVDLLRGLLDGTGVPAGLEVDQELRWLAVVRLAALGGTDVAGIDAEAARDHTLNGVLQAEAARAALPDPATKEATFLALTGESATNAQVRTAGAAFWQGLQADLLLPYVPRYLDALEVFWREQSPEMATMASRFFYPTVLPFPSVRDLVAERLPEVSAPGMRRWLLEAQDDLDRQLRAQQVFSH